MRLIDADELCITIKLYIGKHPEAKETNAILNNFIDILKNSNTIMTKKQYSTFLTLSRNKIIKSIFKLNKQGERQQRTKSKYR